MSGRARRLAAVLAGGLLAGCVTQPVPERDASREPVPAAGVPQAPEPSPAPEVPPAPPVYITVAAVGDMMLGTDYPENILPDDDGVSFLAEVAPVLQAADLAFGNLEGVLLDGGEPAKECRNPRACYLFRSPSRYVEHFVNAGFDVLSLANNHARDFGEEGRTATMETLDAAGILHSGREGDFATLTVEGLEVAVLAFAVTRNSNMMLDYDLAAATVAEHAARHDIVVVSFHGGAEGPDKLHVPFAEEEYFNEPRGDVVYFARRMVDAGADLVLGHGPHVVRAMERYKDRLIAYSLGNFATYYGISVEGLAGIAPILVVTLDREGRFVDGVIHSTEQIRPAGPSFDPAGKALAWIRDLSREDFVTPGIRFEPDGRILPEERRTFVEHRPTPSLAGD